MIKERLNNSWRNLCNWGNAGSATIMLLVVFMISVFVIGASHDMQLIQRHIGPIPVKLSGEIPLQVVIQYTIHKKNDKPIRRADPCYAQFVDRVKELTLTATDYDGVRDVLFANLETNPCNVEVTDVLVSAGYGLILINEPEPEVTYVSSR